MNRTDDFDVENFKRDRAGFREWSETQRQPEIKDDDDHALPSAPQTLFDLLVFLADGYESRTLSERAFVVISVLAPQLIAEDTYKDAADRLGVSRVTLITAMTAFREELPFFSGGGFGSVQTSASRRQSRAEIRFSRRKRFAAEVERLVAKRLAAQELQIEMRHNKLLKRKRDLETAIADAEALLAPIKEKWAELNAEVRRRCAVPEPTPETEAMHPIDRIRADIRKRRGLEGAT